MRHMQLILYGHMYHVYLCIQTFFLVLKSWWHVTLAWPLIIHKYSENDPFDPFFSCEKSKRKKVINMSGMIVRNTNGCHKCDDVRRRWHMAPPRHTSPFSQSTSHSKVSCVYHAEKGDQDGSGGQKEKSLFFLSQHPILVFLDSPKDKQNIIHMKWNVWKKEKLYFFQFFFLDPPFIFITNLVMMISCTHTDSC